MHFTTNGTPQNSRRLNRIFGDNVAYFRLRQGKTQQVLAGLSGVGRRCVLQVENAEVNARMDIVEKIAAGLDVEPYRLFMDSSQAEGRSHRAI